MANSINFDTNNLSAYGLVLTHGNPQDFEQLSDSQLIEDISYSFNPKRLPKIFKLEVTVTANTRATLDGYLDSIRGIVVTDTAAPLKFDTILDRYWMAKLSTFTGSYRAAGWFQGVMIFQADDPLAFDNTEVSSDHNIDADPKTINETTGGTDYISPVFTLTAGEILTGVTIIIENVISQEELQWTGSLGIGEELEIDVANWMVKKTGVDDMATVTGQFPRLIPNAINQITVTGFSNTGTLNITYRNVYR